MAHQTAEQRLETPVDVNTEIKDSGAWAKSVGIAVQIEAVNKEFDAVAGDIAGMVNLPGFRPGKVPRNVIEKKFGDDIKKQVTQNLLQRGLRSAIQKDKLDVVGEPAIDPEKYTAVRGEVFAFNVDVEIKPTFELGNYKGLAVEQEEVDLLPGELDQAVDNLRDRFAETVDAPADHGIANKDVAHGVLRVIVEGNEVHKEEDAHLLLMDGHVLGAYAHLGDKYLEGAKVGEKRTAEETLSGTFPVEAQRGKKGAIEFEVKQIKSRKMPELNDELAAKLDFKTMDELKAKVRTSLLERLKDEVEGRTRSNLVDKVAEATPFDVPVKLQEMMARRTAQSQLQYFARMGMPAEMFASQMENMLEESKKESATEIRRYFILDAIAAKEGIATTDEDIDEEIVKLARKRNTRASELYDQMVQNEGLSELENQVKTRKVLDYLVEQADIKIVPRKPVEKEKGHEHAEHAPGNHGHEQGHEHGHSHGQEQ